MTHPTIGELAPTFVLQDQDGNEVALESFRGKKNVVLYFYPKALTPGCTTQACGLRDIKAELDAYDVEVLGVSIDAVKRLPKFIEKHDLNFTLLSDEDHAVTDLYGCWQLKKFAGKEYMGLVRTTFIIDKEGCLREIMDKFKTKTHHDDLLETLYNLFG